MDVLILGVNGFIGSHLTEAILGRTDWRVYGMDLDSDRVSPWLENARFRHPRNVRSNQQEIVSGDFKLLCNPCRLAALAVCSPLAHRTCPTTYHAAGSNRSRLSGMQRSGAKFVDRAYRSGAN